MRAVRNLEGNFMLVVCTLKVTSCDLHVQCTCAIICRMEVHSGANLAACA